MAEGTFELHPGDALYPKTVLELSDVPETLYVRGDPAVLSTPALSIIGAVYAKDGAEHEELAMDIANSGVTIAGLIPWCIACAVPLSMLGVGVEALPYACLLYLIPLCYLFTKRFFFPAKSKGSETPV